MFYYVSQNTFYQFKHYMYADSKVFKETRIWISKQQILSSTGESEGDLGH